MKSFIRGLILDISLWLGFIPQSKPNTSARRLLAAALASSPNETIEVFLKRYHKDPALTGQFLRLKHGSEVSVTYGGHREHYKSHDFLFGVPETQIENS